MSTLVTRDNRLLSTNYPTFKDNYIVTAGGQGTVKLSGQLTATFETIYESNPSCFALVNKLVRLLSTLPVKVYDRPASEDQPEELRNHPLTKLLNEPVPRRSQAYWKQGLFRPALLHGNGLLAKWRVEGEPKALIPASWPYVAGYAPLGCPIEWWSTFQTGTQRFFPAADSVHFAWESQNLNGLGVSPLKPLAETVQLDDALRRYQTASMANAARPSKAIIPPEGFRYEGNQKDELRAEVQRVHGGVDQAMKDLLLAPGFDVKVLSQTAVEAEVIAARAINVEEFARVYDVPPPMIGDLTHGTYCLPADAMVSTERGPVPIIDVQAGDRVWSMTYTGLQLRPVSWSGQTGVKPLLTIRTQNRTLRCTDNHPVRVARPLDRRKPENEHAYYHEWTPAGQLEVGDIILTATSLPEKGVRSCPTRENVSVGFAEFCGLMLGDGSIDLKRGMVSVARASDTRYMDHYRAVMRAEFAASDSSRAATQPVALAERDRDTRFVSRSAADELHALGITGTAHTKRVPEWVHLLAPDLRAAFLRGFVEADGSVDKKGHVSVHSANELLLRQVRELCIGLGVPVTNYRAQRGWVTLPDGKRIYSVMWSFKCSDPGVNASIIASHDSQDMARMEAGKPWEAKTYSYPTRSGGLPERPAHCGHAKVISIEKDDVGVPVYDLTVPETHSFVAEGVVVHNSNVEELHRILYVTTLRPWFKFGEEILQAQLVTEEESWSDDIYIQFDLGEVLRGNRREELDAASEAFNNGIYTLNEARAMVDAPPVRPELDPEGLADMPHVQANNLRPITQPEAPEDPNMLPAGADPDETKGQPVTPVKAQRIRPLAEDESNR